MKVIVTFEADSTERLREQMLMFLGQPVPVAQAKPAKSKTAKSVPEIQIEEPQQEPPVEEPEILEDEPVTPEAQSAVDLLKLKEQQLSRLRDLFNAGKGPLVRDLLKKYGEGAKVFPEVEAKNFPAIKIELDRELGMQ